MKKNIKKVENELAKVAAKLAEEVAGYETSLVGSLDHIRLVAMLARVKSDINVFNECVTRSTHDGTDPIAEFRKLALATAAELYKKLQAGEGDDTKAVFTFAGEMDGQFHTLGILRTIS